MAFNFWGDLESIVASRIDSGKSVDRKADEHRLHLYQQAGKALKVARVTGEPACICCLNPVYDCKEKSMQKETNFRGSRCR